MCIDDCKEAGLQPPDGHQWSEYDKSLYEISATEPDASGNVQHCLACKKSGKVRAVWFDQVMSHWTDLTNSFPQTRRIDAYYRKGDAQFLIEFKRVKSLTPYKDKLWLKFHDSLTQLMDHGWVTLREAKKNLTYIVVRIGQHRRYSKDDFTESGFARLSEKTKQAMSLGWVTEELNDAMLRPWNYPVKADCDLWAFEGISCRRVLTMTVQQFDRLADEAHWNNPT